MKSVKPILAFLISFNLFSQKFLPKSSGEIVKHNYFTLYYNEVHKQPNWVHYRLSPAFLNGSTPRKDSFKPDP